MKAKRESNQTETLKGFIQELNVMHLRLFLDQNGQDCKWSPACMMAQAMGNELQNILDGEYGETADRLRYISGVFTEYADMLQENPQLWED